MFPFKFLTNDMGACFFCQFPRSSTKYVRMCLCVPEVAIMATMNGQGGKTQEPFSMQSSTQRTTVSSDYLALAGVTSPW